MMLDYYNDTQNSFSGGFRDWIPDEEDIQRKKEAENFQPKADGKGFDVSKLTDQDIRDLGFDPVAYRLKMMEKDLQTIKNSTLVYN